MVRRMAFGRVESIKGLMRSAVPVAIQACKRNLKSDRRRVSLLWPSSFLDRIFGGQKMAVKGAKGTESSTSISDSPSFCCSVPQISSSR